MAVGLTKNLSLWAFGGIDQPDENQARRAGATFALAGQTLIRNVQIMGQLAYTEGPIQIGLELMYVITTGLVTPNPMMPTVRVAEVHSVMQPSLTMNFNF